MQKSDNFMVLAIPRHSANPNLDLLYAAVEKTGATVRNGSRREIVTGQYDIVHYHWVEVFLNLPSRWQRLQAFMERFLLMLVIKFRGKKAVWTMHDIQPHEQQGRLLPHLYRRIFFWSIDGIIALSDVSAQIMLERYPALRGKPLLQSRIGNYRSSYPQAVSRQQARELAGLTPNEVVIGFFGSIRPYKNVPHLVRVFQQLNDPTLHMSIAGKCIDDALAQELALLTADDPRIQLKLEFVPVLMPAQGTLVEIVAPVGPEWVRRYPDTLTLKILADALQWAAQPRTTPAPLEHFSWETSGKATANFLRALAQGNL